VIPKEPAATIDQLSDEASAAIGRVLPRITRAVLAASGAKACNILQNNGADAHQAVMHVHFHIIPKFVGDALPGGQGAGLGIGWKAGKLDGSADAALAKEIGASLQ
jgi:histidine triad (HIT) family protein